MKEGETKMAAKRSLYEVLGIGKTADEKTIRKHIGNWQRKYHPDMNPGIKQQNRNSKRPTLIIY